MTDVVIRLPLVAAEALSDAVEGDAEGWPDEWPDHTEAFVVALAVDDALNGEAGPPDCCVHRIEHRYGLLDHELHNRLVRAALTYLAEPWRPRVRRPAGNCDPTEVLAAIKADVLAGTGPGCGDRPPADAY